MRPLLVVLAFGAATALARPVVLLAPALGAPGQVTLWGRVLKHAPTGRSTFSRNVRSLTASSWGGAAVECRYSGRSVKTTAGADGNFSVTFEGPFTPGVSTAEAHVDGAEVGRALVHVVSPAAPFVVISDLDDTLAVTQVVKKTALVTAALAQDAQTQPVVPGMSDFYACLEEDQPARPGFALVSGSPRQFLPRVQAFLARHQFPVFGISLRDLGPATLSNYKQPVIRALLAALPQPVVLVGDSGEKDPEVYAQIRSEFPDRVKAIYIRNAGGSVEDAARFKDMVLFSQPNEAARDAAARGLLSASCLNTRFPKVDSK